MTKPPLLPRRLLLAGALGACACATLPAVPDQAGPRPTPPDARRCEHQGCRYFVPGEVGALGRCGLGLPEAFR